jgi:hypothetical protein
MLLLKAYSYYCAVLTSLSLLSFIRTALRLLQHQASSKEQQLVY